MDKQKIHELKPLINLGKNGLTDSLIEEINVILKKKKYLKIKINKNFPGDKSIITKIAEKTNSKVLDIRGFTFVLFKA